MRKIKKKRGRTQNRLPLLLAALADMIAPSGGACKQDFWRVCRLITGQWITWTLGKS
jgi:hypothetical protein